MTDAERSRAWKRRNPEKVRAQLKRYKASHRKQDAAYTRLRKRRLRIGRERINAADLLTIARNQNWRCYWCCKSVKRHRQTDHLIPLCKGGRHVKQNIRIVCRPCNQLKYTLLPMDWVIQLLMGTPTSAAL